MKHILFFRIDFLTIFYILENVFITHSIYLKYLQDFLFIFYNLYFAQGFHCHEHLDLSCNLVRLGDITVQAHRIARRSQPHHLKYFIENFDLLHLYLYLVYKIYIRIHLIQYTKCICDSEIMCSIRYTFILKNVYRTKFILVKKLYRIKSHPFLKSVYNLYTLINLI